MDFRADDYLKMRISTHRLPFETVKGHPNYRWLSDPNPGPNWGAIGIMGVYGAVLVGFASMLVLAIKG